MELSTEFAGVTHTYEEFINMMERARIAYQRGGVFLRDGIPDFCLTFREKHVKDPRAQFGLRNAYKTSKWHDFKNSNDPMPLDLRAYIIAKQYDPNKRTFPKVIAELAKHKDQ